MNRPRLLTLIALAFLCLPSFAAAITIDGNLADLEAAINASPDQTGSICTDLTGELGSAGCTYYANGYDIKRFLVFVDSLRNPDGTPTGDATIYAGWETAGKIGDGDGNGDPDTYTPGVNCSTGGDFVGIGPFESYTVDFDFNVDGEIDARFGVKSNKVINFFTLESVSGGQFAFVNNTLEVTIPNIRANSGSSFSICDMRVSGGSNAEFDQLAEDYCLPGFAFTCPVPTRPGSWGTIKATYR